MKTCYHCREPIPKGLDIHTQMAGEEAFFCCHACLAVAEIINQNHLGQYYRVRERAAPRPENLFDYSQWQAYDLPEVAKQYVYQEGEENEIHLYIDGLHCAACSWLISRALKTKLGITQSRINISTGRAEIRWQDIPLSKILATIAELGYKPNLYTPEQVDSQQEKGRNQNLLRLIVAGLGMMQVMMFATGLYSGDFLGIEGRYSALLRWISLLCTTPVLFYSGLPFFQSAWAGLRQQHLNMDLPIALATGGAYVASVYHTFIGRGEIYFDSVTMFIFFLTISRTLEAQTRRRARLNEHRFARLLPDAVYKMTAGKAELVPLAVIQPADEIQVLPTHTIPIDGEILVGESRIDESMLTGESTPRFKSVGERVFAGSTNLQSPLQIRVTETGQQTTLAAIRRISARAEQHRSPQIDQNEKIAQWTVFTVLMLAAAGYLLWQWIDPARAFDIALAVLVATCPCALSLATPTVLTAALNHAHKAAILIKNSATLDRLLEIETVLFDKTGTLTEGHYRLIAFETFGEADPAYLRQVAKSLEQHSTHPVAWYFSQQPCPMLPVEKIEHQANGMSGEIAGERWFIGNAAFLRQCSIAVDEDLRAGNHIYLAREKTLSAHFLLHDPERPNLPTTFAHLPVQKLAIASGDKTHNVKKLAQAVGISEFRGDLSAEGKLQYLETFNPAKTLMIGDGINDAPVLARAAVSVAVGRANPLSQTHADVVFLQHGTEALPFLFALARASKKIIRQNLLWASAYNATVIPLAICGYLTPWIAALGMSISSLLVVGNALRIRSVPFLVKSS